MRFGLTLSAIVISGAAVAAAMPFRINVVDAECGWPVPLVQFTTLDGQVFVSDNAGVVGVDSPELFGRRVRFSVEGHGYDVPKDSAGEKAVVLDVRQGGKVVVKMNRSVLARRLGRIGGTGLFVESRKFGEHLDKVDQGEVGRDSVQCRQFGDRLFWLWGDTSMQHYAIGIFNTTAAYTKNPAFPRDPKPPVYPPYDQIRDDKGKVRGVIKAQGSGPIWVFGLIDLKDRAGRDHLGGAWSQIRGFCDAYKNGLCEWNAKEDSFDVTLQLMDKDNKVFPEFFPDNNPVRWTDPRGKKWLLYGFPFPHHRIPDSYEAWRDTNTWERVDWSGREKVAKMADGSRIESASGQMMWSSARKKWVGICQRKLDFGSLVYMEADSPFGPWTGGRVVVRHENYTFYNPVIHLECGADAPYILFEATYTDAFVNNPNPTPRYNYTQMLYRLDFKDLK